MRSALLFLILASPWQATAAQVDRELDQIAAMVRELYRIGDELDHNAQGGTDFVSSDEATERFEDALFAWLTNKHDLAAERFFVLVGVLDEGTPLKRDAEWYLAESMYASGQHEAALRRLLAMAEDSDHPFCLSAHGRLVAHYAHIGDDAQFEHWYQRTIDRGGVSGDEDLAWSVGKALLTRGEVLEAKAILLELTSSPVYAMRARYALGALDVTQARLDDAIGWFLQNMSADVSLPADRQVVDLSGLALGRVYYELEDFNSAAEYYSRISGDSDFLDDALYELAWTNIERDDVAGALHAIDIYLLRFPESAHAGRLRVVRGHLMMRAERFDEATDLYEHVVENWEELRSKARTIVADEQQAGVWAAGGATEQDGVPSWVGNLFASNDEVTRAWSVKEDLRRQRLRLDEAQEILVELETVLAREEQIALNRHQRMANAVTRGLSIAGRQQLALLSIESNLSQWRSSEARALARSLKDSRANLQSDLDKLDRPFLDEDEEARLSSLVDSVSALKKAHRDAPSSEGPAPDVMVQLEELHEAIDVLRVRLEGVLGSISEQRRTTADLIRQQVDRERKTHREVANSHALALRTADTAWRDAVSIGAGSVDGFLTQAILEADQGLVDAYWAQMHRTKDRRRIVAEDYYADLAKLEARFRSLRDRLK